jgi:Arc/MetJ-type ribon-helix-helix transcriptional regulator
MVARNDENFALPADLADAIRQRVGVNGFANATEVLRAAMALLNSSTSGIGCDDRGGHQAGRRG